MPARLCVSHPLPVRKETSMSVRIPLIAFNALTVLDPKYIGLAAWLGASEIYPTDRKAIMMHVAKTGAIDESIVTKFDSPSQLAAAAQAHEDWQRFLAELGTIPAPKPAPVLFKRNGFHPDPAGVNGQENPDDIDF